TGRTPPHPPARRGSPPAGPRGPRRGPRTGARGRSERLGTRSRRTRRTRRRRRPAPLPPGAGPPRRTRGARWADGIAWAQPLYAPASRGSNPAGVSNDVAVGADMGLESPTLDDRWPGPPRKHGPTPTRRRSHAFVLLYPVILITSVSQLAFSL